METDSTSETCDETSSVKCLKQNWEKWSDDHREYQKHNPFSDHDVLLPHPKQGQEEYGRPLEGSETERRGKEAHSHIHKEVTELCQIISAIGHRQGDGTTQVEFGTLFEHYISISNKLVGVLLRARKQGLVHFEGEMLWQGRDNRVLIKLLA
ncbi:actin-binding Rho-activating protein-like [Trichomycterus rosablanca]|uniref:actin-binding Rho-activating protein-like n=1 Tax=Trichomycterus rosablanca TaxID=2290929 RepID=UPI002F35E535